MALNSGKNMKNGKVFNLIKLSLIIFTIFSFINILPAQALPDIDQPLVFTPQVGLPGLADKGQQISLTNGDTSYLAQMVKGFYNYGLGIAGILAAIVLMAGGVLWLTSAGSSDKISQAKGLIMGSITGLLLVFGSWLILKTINPYLLNFKIRDIKGIVAIFLEDGKDGFIDSIKSLPEDAVIKYKCLRQDDTCLDTNPPSTQLNLSICRDKFGNDFSCQDPSYPQKACCAISEEMNKEINQQCTNKNYGTECQPTPTSPENSGYCENGECKGGSICCQCGRACGVGVCAYTECRNDLTPNGCKEWCSTAWTDWDIKYYYGGSSNYTCAEGAYSYCTAK